MNDAMNDATQSYHGGIKYNVTYITSGWGEGDDSAGEIDYDATNEMLSNRVVKLFESMVKQKLGVKVTWFPSLSEVYCRHGDVETLFPDSEICPVDEIRDNAHNTVWDDWCNGDIAPIIKKGS